MYATANKMAMKEEVEAEIVEMLGEARYYHLARGESHGRHYKDEHGVTWDDEGYNSAGTGPSDRRERAMHKAKPAATKHYHEVPYAKKEDAKREGMKWHAEKKKWYHTDPGKSATSKFKKLHEEVIDEAAHPDTAAAEVEGVLTTELFTEEHATREAAQKRLEAIEKKHPLAKHSVIQGRRTGKWHVVRHTSGGMHVVEGYEPEFDELIEDCGLDSKGDWRNYKSKADKKKSDGIDDDGGDKKAKDNIKEGDESEADYQKYKKEHEEKQRKEHQAKQQRAATIKSLIRRTK
jgi:hypothetical protein